MTRLVQEEIRQRLEAQYLEPEAQRIYRRRKEKVEHPFGHIKRNLNRRSFLLRGREWVKAEASLFATCFNIRRMMTLCGGVLGFMEAAKHAAIT